VRFHKGSKLERWGILVIRDGGRDDFTGVGDPALDAVLAGFTSMCKASGMQVDAVPPSRLVADLPPKRRDDPIRADAIKAIQTELLSMRERKIPKPKLLMVCWFCPSSPSVADSPPVGHALKRR
jgi:eukaryotic translation initiation factor 2C